MLITVEGKTMFPNVLNQAKIN